MFSVCIPRIFNNIPVSKIVSTFESLNLGKVERVDIVMRRGKNNEPIKMAFVHFYKWYNNSAANNLRKKIEDPNYEAKIVYSDPWYWVILPNRSEDDYYINTPLVFINKKLEKKLEKIEHKLNLCKQLFLRNHISSVKPEYFVNHGPMTMSELQDDNDTPCYIRLRYAKIYPENLDSDDSEEDDLNVVKVMNCDYKQLNITDKMWMTQNVCDNA
jgi:hypothetical protein